MTDTPTSGTAVLGSRPGPLSDADGIRERAIAALASAGLTVEAVVRRLPLNSISWQAKIVAALAGERPFTSLTIALFAETVGADVLWLITGDASLAVTVRACAVDESVGVRSYGAETAEVRR